MMEAHSTGNSTEIHAEKEIGLLLQFLAIIKCRSEKYFSTVEDFANSNVGKDTASFEQEFQATKKYLLKLSEYLQCNYKAELEAIEIPRMKDLLKKISHWEKIRQQINKDFDDSLKIYKESKANANCQLIQFVSDKLQLLLEQLEYLESQFLYKPKGPIGLSVTIHKTWLDICQHILKPVEMIFIVDNSADAHLLNTLIDSIFGSFSVTWPPLTEQRPDVWVSSFSKENVVTDEASTCSSLLTLGQAIKIKDQDPVIRNFLREYARTEKTLLFRTQHEAFPIMADADELPGNCLVAYTQDFYKILPKPSFKSVKIFSDEDKSFFTSGGVIKYSPVPSTNVIDESTLKLMKINLYSLKDQKTEMEKLISQLKQVGIETSKGIEEYKLKIQILTKGDQCLQNIDPFYFRDSLQIILTKDNNQLEKLIDDELSKVIQL